MAKDYNKGGGIRKRGEGPYTEGVKVTPARGYDNAGNPVNQKPREHAAAIEKVSARTDNAISTAGMGDGLSASLPPGGRK